MENRAHFQELLQSRKENLEALQNKTGHLGRLLKRKEELQHKEDDLRSSDEELKIAYTRYAEGQIPQTELNKCEKKHSEIEKTRPSVTAELEAINEQIRILQPHIRQIQEALRSLNRYIWQIVFTKVKAEFIEKIRPELEELFVILNGAIGLMPGPGAIDIIFNDMYGKNFSFGPPREKIEALKIQLEQDYFGEDKI